MVLDGFAETKLDGKNSLILLQRPQFQFNTRTAPATPLMTPRKKIRTRATNI
jgi:hypothetical protein